MRCSRQRRLTSWERRCVSKKSPDFGQEFVDGAAPVVSSYIRVELKPQALDVILVGTVRGQKVEPESASPLGERHLDDLAGMNGVVVEDQVKHSGSAIASQQSAQQVQEEPAPFLVALNPDQMTCAVAQSSGKEALYVLTGSENPTLLSGQGPVRAES